MGKRLFGLVILVLLLLAGIDRGAQAQSCAEESEPNSDPALAQRISGCVAGTLIETDDDFYRLTVPPEQAGMGFVLTFDGIPSALSRAELFAVQEGDRTESLLVVTVPSGGEASSDPFLLEGGDYLIAVYSGGGTGSYQVRLDPGAKPPASGDKEPNDRQDQATQVSGILALSGALGADADWYRWTVSPAGEGEVWSLTAQAALTRRIDVSLYDASGILLAQRGRDTAGRAALAGLRLAAGDYFLRLNGDGKAGNAYQLTTTSLGVPAPGIESEPNDYVAQAQGWKVDDPLSGQLNGAGDVDAYRVTVDEDEGETSFDLRLLSDSRERRTLCLRLPDNSELQCREALGEVVLPDVALDPGEYLVTIAGNADPTEEYSLSRRVTGVREAGRENEPNDRYANASPLDAQHRARGRFSSADVDYYRLAVEGEPQLWRIQVIGDGIGTVSLVNAVGNPEQYVGASGQRRVRLNGVYLLPGTHYIALRGEEGDYRVMAIPLGPPPEGAEQEPNDTPGQANLLRFGEERTGLLNEKADTDVYRFTLPVEEHVRLTVTPPDDTKLQVRVQWDEAFEIARHDDTTLGSAAYVLDTILQPGDYTVRLAAAEPGDSPYTLNLERGDPFEPVDDVEPNGAAELASPIPATLSVNGSVTRWTDDDWYRLPTLSVDTAVEIEAPPAVSISLYDADGQPLSSGLTRDSAAGSYTGTLPASAAQPVVMNVTGDGRYTIRLSFDNGPAAAPLPTPLPLKLGLTLEEEEVAAFWPVGQAVSGTLTLDNSGSQALTVGLDAHASQPMIEARSDQEQVTVPSRGRTTVPVTLIVAADLPTGIHPVTWRARAVDGGQVTATAELASTVDASPQSPRRVWPLPASMLGGLNAASLSLGAQIVTPESDLAKQQEVLHDGYTALQDAFKVSADKLPLSITVKLAGNGPVPVSGILLNPQSSGPAYEKLNEFELWLSQDGQSFERALAGSLSTRLAEQAFLLPQPTSARYARLVLISNHQGNRGYVALGEWKVVATPGTQLITPVDLAAPANGGEIVYVLPQPSVAEDAASMLEQDGRDARIPLSAGASAELVVGFQHGRTAQITSVRWVEPPGLDPAHRLTEVALSASLDSPVGPWTSLGHWELVEGSSTFNLPAPAWARYLRLTSTAQDEAIQVALPDLLQVFERSTGAEYRSILGEWGHYRSEGAYEWLTPPPSAGAAIQGDNDSLENARAVAADTPVEGTVQIGRNVAWYRMDVPEAHNAVVLRLSGQPTLGVTAVFQNGAGELLPAIDEGVSPAVEVITATVKGGSTVYFRIEEPQRSVVFAWDNSASLGAYQNQIYRALTSYIEGVTPGREVANLLPFGSALLLQGWGEDPTVLQQALNDYDRGDSSSNAEGSLLTAAEELAYRAGTKAVVLISDAESNGYDLTAELWKALDVVRPRVFTLAVSSHVTVGDAPANPQDLMQNWAAVNGGHYDFLRTVGELDVAFARAEAWLRRPATYSFTAHSAALPPPSPGKLTVLSSLTGDDTSARAELLGDTVVEIIFDASGSMTEKLGSSTRIAVAKDTMVHLVDNVLPQGIPLALRAFGNREGNGSCRTDLELPLAPLDPAVVKAKVDTITPQRLGGTPIAASLLKVGEDLQGAGPGPKLVILLTDGEESCGGEPAAAIRALREQGIDVRLNIVGFTVSDQKLQRQMTRWATEGGGLFLPAADQQALSNALAQALRVPYRVLDAQDQVVAQGLVDGDPVELPVGVYRVEILTSPLQTLEGVTIGSGRDTVLRVAGSG